MLYNKEADDRDALENQIKKLQAKLKDYPKFRDGLFHLAGTWLALHRTKEAYDVLVTYHKIDPKNPVVEYYLAALALERMQLNEGKIFLKNTQQLLKEQSYYPNALKDLYMAYKKEDPTFNF